MKSKTQKKEELKSLQAKLPEAQMTIFTSFARMGEKGLSVAQMTELKRMLRGIKSEYVVTKKTIMERATSSRGADVYAMDGSLGLVVGPPASDSGEASNDAYNVAKKVYEFARKNTALQFFGALLNGTFINKEQFMEMAKMPSREVLIGRLFGMMKYPVTGLYTVMTEIAKKKLIN